MGNSETEQKILEAAIRCIEKCGIKNTTVRQIAKEADVNLAAVNYHFGSKEELINRVMDETLANAFDTGHIRLEDNAGPKESLVQIMAHLAKGMLLYPNITRAHFYRPFLEGDCNCAAVVQFSRFTDNLAEKLCIGQCGKEMIKNTVLQVFSIVFCTSLMPAVFSSAGDVRLHNDAELMEYIRSVVERLWQQ